VLEIGRVSVRGEGGDDALLEEAELVAEALGEAEPPPFRHARRHAPTWPAATGGRAGCSGNAPLRKVAGGVPAGYAAACFPLPTIAAP